MNDISKKQLGNMEISAFCNQLSMILNAGIPIYEGVSILLEDAPDAHSKKLLSSIYKPLDEGESFHLALTQSGYFPKYVLDMVEVGEQAGKLDEVLASLSNYYEREERVRNGIRNAVTYPILMVIMMLAIIAVLITKVLPIFNQIYIELGSGLSGFPLIMMNISTALNNCMLYIVIAFAIILIAAFILARSDAGKALLKKHSIAKLTASSRFANCMYLALSSGLDIEQGLALSEQLVDNPLLSDKIHGCIELLASGSSFAEALNHLQIFDRLYTSMVTIGFKTGTTEEVMNKIAKEYEDRIDLRIARFIAILEPALVIVMSVLVGIILLSFLVPLIGIMNNIG